MNIAQSLKMGVAATILWLSTSGSAFAVTSLVSDNNQSITPAVPTNLISQVDIRRLAGQVAGFNTVGKFDEIWKSKTDVQQRLFEHCKTQTEASADKCFSGLQLWALDQVQRGSRSGNFLTREDIDLLMSIMDGVSAMRG